MSDLKKSLEMQGIKVKSEEETKRLILKNARQLGCETEAKKIFERYEKIAQQVGNSKDRQALATMMAQELYKLMDCYEGLTVNGLEVIPADTEYMEGLRHFKKEEFSKIKKM